MIKKCWILLMILGAGTLGAQNTLTLPDGRVIKSGESHLWDGAWYPLKDVTLYEKPDPMSPSKKVVNPKAAVFGPLFNEKWLYLVSKDFSIKGYISLDSITGDSFYGAPSDQESGNTYLLYLAQERQLLANRKDILRRGPLLTFNQGPLETRLMDSLKRFGSYYTLVKDLGLYFVVREQFWEGALFHFYEKGLGALSFGFPGEPQESPGTGLHFYALDVKVSGDPLFLHIFSRTSKTGPLTLAAKLDLGSYIHIDGKDLSYQGRWTGPETILVSFENAVQVEVKKTGEKWVLKEVPKK